MNIEITLTHEGKFHEAWLNYKPISEEELLIYLGAENIAEAIEDIEELKRIFESDLFKDVDVS
jgi:hypothetical protein